MICNHLKKIRESLMISKAELSRKANISPITLARIEQGKPCRMETKRRIVLALGMKVSDKNGVFDENQSSSDSDQFDRRSGIDRREISYAVHIPEQRSGNDRRESLKEN
ncbi:MAG: helix-turn-helix transcriptional regulator [Desulfobacterales bacterium]